MKIKLFIIKGKAEIEDLKKSQPMKTEENVFWR
jgi:hypothetical protein